MISKLIQADGVERDLAGHVAVIVEGGQPAAAQGFLDAYESCTDTLREWPYSGFVLESPDPGLNHLRVGKLAAPFHHYSVFYAVEDRVVRVLAVIHAAMGEASRRRLLQGRGGAG